MNKNDTINIIGYPESNLSRHPSIKHLSWIYPTLGWEIENILRKKGIQNDKEFCIWDFSTNNSFDLKNFKNDKKSLIEILDKLSEILWNKKPIIFLSDWCFTNDLFVRELWEILEDDYSKYVEEVNISYEDVSKNHHISNYLYENSILILGWSLVNLDNVPKEFYDSELVTFIKDVHNNKINSKLIWICWWHQLISHIIWLDEILSEKIITTYIWEAQFWVMPSKLATSINNIPFAYRWAINAITNNWKNSIALGVLTRIWHIDLDFLLSYRLQSQSLFPILVDPLTNSLRICWSRNSQYFWVQDHFEINPAIDSDILYKNTYNLLENLVNIYWTKVEKILSNIEKQCDFQNKLWQPLYSSILLSFANSIVAKDRYKKNNIKEKNKDYWRKISNKELESIISKENFWEKPVSEWDFLEKLDKEGILRLLTYLDWSISRWIDEVSNILWFDLLKFIWIHMQHLKNNKINTWSYVFRDLWAGRWRLIDDINEKIDSKKELDTIEYWISDYAYFNIYECLSSLNEFKDIPRNILKIFVEELIIYYKKLNTWNEKEKILKSLEEIKLKAKSFKICSMFSDSTTYRYNNQEEELTKEDIDFINKQIDRIDDLKKYIKNNFYDLIKWNYKKMIFSDFNSLYINDKAIKKIDWQIALRTTSHVDSKKIRALLKDHIDFFAKPGSFFIDNWIVRSDSWVPRIQEHIDTEDSNSNIKTIFNYDINTGYITFANVTMFPFIPKEEIQSCCHDWHILLSTSQIRDWSFFKIERFFRELIIFTFKNLQFTHEKNKYIVECLKEISSEMNSKTPEEIKEIIIEKINNLIEIVNKEYNKKYKKMNIEIFEQYLEYVGDDIIDFFKKWKINIPEWFNPNFERNN